jgi:hypothetical protein
MGFSQCVPQSYGTTQELFISAETLMALGHSHGGGGGGQPNVTQEPVQMQGLAFFCLHKSLAHTHTHTHTHTHPTPNLKP